MLNLSGIREKELERFLLSSKTGWANSTGRGRVGVVTPSSGAEDFRFTGIQKEKFEKTHLISSTKETKQAHQIQSSIRLRASWHSKILHICLECFEIPITDTRVSLSHPEIELSNIRCKPWMWNELKTACSPRFSPGFLVYVLGRRKSRARQLSPGTAAVLVICPHWYTNLWEAMLNVTA